MKDIDFRDYFYYDGTSPSFLRWKIEVRNGEYGKSKLLAEPHKMAGCVDVKGYYNVGLKGKVYKVHRIIWLLTQGYIEGHIDHIDGNPSNNNINNLRCVKRGINSKNQKMNRNNTSGVNGVMAVNLKGIRYWRASWYLLDTHKRACKSFRVDVFGEEAAKQMAVDYRKKMIEELNALGAGYTERHGT